MEQLDNKAVERRPSQTMMTLDQMRKQKENNEKEIISILSKLRDVYSHLGKKDFENDTCDACLKKLKTLQEKVIAFYEIAKADQLLPKDDNVDGHQKLVKYQLRAINLLEQIAFAQAHADRVEKLYNASVVAAGETYDASLTAAAVEYEQELERQRNAPQDLNSWKQTAQPIPASEPMAAGSRRRALREQRDQKESIAEAVQKAALSTAGKEPSEQFSRCYKYVEAAESLRQQLANLAAEYKQLASEVAEQSGLLLKSLTPRPKKPKSQDPDLSLTQESEEQPTAAAVVPPLKENVEKQLEAFNDREAELTKDLLKLKGKFEAMSKGMLSGGNASLPSISITLPSVSNNENIPSIQEVLQTAYSGLEGQLTVMVAYCNSKNSQKFMKKISERSERGTSLKNFDFARFGWAVVKRQSVVESKQSTEPSRKLSVAGGDAVTPPVMDSKQAGTNIPPSLPPEITIRRDSSTSGPSPLSVNNAAGTPTNNGASLMPPPPLSRRASVTGSPQPPVIPSPVRKPSGSVSGEEVNLVVSPVNGGAPTPVPSPRNNPVPPPPLSSRKSSMSGSVPQPPQVAPPRRLSAVNTETSSNNAVSVIPIPVTERHESGASAVVSGLPQIL